jgi:hypothetical protein
LFATRKIAFNATLVIFIYAALGLAYPLYNGFLGSYLTLKQAEVGSATIDSVYSAYTYQAACGILGSIFATVLVQMKGGRKTAMGTFTILSGVFLFGLTQATNAAQINVLTCFAALWRVLILL